MSDIDRTTQHGLVNAAIDCLTAHKAQPYRDNQEGAYQLTRAAKLIAEAQAHEVGAGALPPADDIDFTALAVGQKIRMPHLKWGGANRELMERAHIACMDTGMQFVAHGNDEGSGYWLERTR